LLHRGVSRTAKDTVDGLPELQLSLSRQQLEGCIGSSAVASLWTLPRQLDRDAPPRFTQYRCFARLYGADQPRRSLGLHTDECDWTVNVSLSDPDSHAGGELVVLHSGRAHALARAEGDATVHHWSVVHGVAPVVRGERASLIIFFYGRRQPRF
jgi:predicted 2-oxoglutarate/Fe(II)-dependent dioxygenase YbiX